MNLTIPSQATIISRRGIRALLAIPVIGVAATAASGIAALAVGGVAGALFAGDSASPASAWGRSALHAAPSPGPAGTPGTQVTTGTADTAPKER